MAILRMSSAVPSPLSDDDWIDFGDYIRKRKDGHVSIKYSQYTRVAYNVGTLKNISGLRRSNFLPNQFDFFHKPWDRSRAPNKGDERRRRAERQLRNVQAEIKRRFYPKTAMEESILAMKRPISHQTDDQYPDPMDVDQITYPTEMEWEHHPTIELTSFVPQVDLTYPESMEGVEFDNPKQKKDKKDKSKKEKNTKEKNTKEKNKKGKKSSNEKKENNKKKTSTRVKIRFIKPLGKNRMAKRVRFRR